MHHIISDGWSAGVLIREVAALYEVFSPGKPSPFAELGVQYADFAVCNDNGSREQCLKNNYPTGENNSGVLLRCLNCQAIT